MRILLLYLWTQIRTKNKLCTDFISCRMYYKQNTSATNISKSTKLQHNG